MKKPKVKEEGGCGDLVMASGQLTFSYRRLPFRQFFFMLVFLLMGWTNLTYCG